MLIPTLRGEWSQSTLNMSELVLGVCYVCDNTPQYNYLTMYPRDHEAFEHCSCVGFIKPLLLFLFVPVRDREL